MASFTIIENFEPIKDSKMLDKAKSFNRELFKKTVNPCRIIKGLKIDESTKRYVPNELIEIEKMKDIKLQQDENIIIDFGNHFVGKLKIKIAHSGSHPDAPGFIKLKMAEIIDELAADSSNYEGWISKGWIQEEWIHIDEFPMEIKLDRRYALRYLQLDVLATSAKYKIYVEEVSLEAESWIDFKDNPQLKKVQDKELIELDKVGLRTLRNSMQNVYEDGPKRDRRLWLGDLRLQALTNYYSFNDLELVKKCLYLFSASKFPNKSLGACLFVSPEVQVDDTNLIDYSLIFISTVYDYYEHTKDIELVKEFWEVIMDQVNTTWEFLGEQKMTNLNNDTFWSFIDWNPELDKNAAIQGVYITTYKHAIYLANVLGKNTDAKNLEEKINLLSEVAKNNYWDEKQGLFVSGDQKQISYHSNIWMVLSGLFDQEKNKKILKKIIEVKPAIKLKTPYAYHYFLEALFLNDMQEEAVKIMKYYWGEMIKLGADTFWELFDPEDPFYSPYGSSIVNSYCHAWSCAPTYFIRKYMDK
ncbi:Bacterial alpha-L-rhamnosidase [Spiroplasma chinense]|uniref:Bacterial alpha-L-rhamnosidase n=1 Tax=Spiroplasma chinense TaxID=216932 RepID=A0A5B9Y6V5_9MOLU|nr:hypothetical protein [Spiroplasma chinense]QEH61997.1 Bacterial alpha-L-rhamnosidase [Spiroplasma chinense]